MEVDEGPSSAGAYYSQDFEWDALREEVMERMPEFLCQTDASPSTVENSSGEEAPSTSTSWETFHTRHSRNVFFKERRYLTKEFPELLQAENLLEVGCGTGSSVVPIVRENKHAVVYACDCSAAALQKASQVVPSTASFHPFLCDISLSALPEFLRSLDIVTMIFTLSAIPVERMVHVLSECFRVLKPGGLLLFRDYGLYDMTMLRFSPRHQISSCLYRRDDGTLSYFFSLEFVRSLLLQVGFVEIELEYCCVQLMNRRKQVPMKRVWVHAKLQKPYELRPK